MWSFNNYWGLLLILVNCLVDIDYVVLEMGMNYMGEISLMFCLVCLDIVYINNIFLVYIGFLGSIENIVYAKVEIFEGLFLGGVGIIHKDSLC